MKINCCFDKFKLAKLDPNFRYSTDSNPPDNKLGNSKTKTIIIKYVTYK
jgi:hypothetical protein